MRPFSEERLQIRKKFRRLQMSEEQKQPSLHGFLIFMALRKFFGLLKSLVFQKDGVKVYQEFFQQKDISSGHITEFFFYCLKSLSLGSSELTVCIRITKNYHCFCRKFAVSSST